MILTKLLLSVALLVALPFSVAAMEISEVVSTSPSWETFTNSDGTGLYHDILNEVFALYGIPVRHEYAKSIRSVELVMSNEADMMTCSGTNKPTLVKARYPMYESAFYVFYKKERIGPWQGIESLRDKEILSQATYYDATDFSVPVNVKSVVDGAQALGMIVLDRSDFYVDDIVLIRQSMEESAVPFQMDDYAIERAGTRPYMPLFNTSERGKAIMKLYDEGIFKLHQAGKLKAIYEKWGHPYPSFDSY